MCQEMTTEYTQQGMTLRDYFAAKCLSGDFVASDEGCYARIDR
jgi:hypothetical protein